MTRVRPIRPRRNQVRHQVCTRVDSNVHPGVPSPAATSARWCSPIGCRMSGVIPLTPHAATAWADLTAKDDRTGRQGDAQVCVTRCRPCGHALPEGSRRHLNRCQDVRANRSTGQPKAWRLSGNCTDWLCKYGYHHTIVLQSSLLDDETRLAKGYFPLESLRWTSPSSRHAPNWLRPRFLHGWTVDPAMQQVVTWRLSIHPRWIVSHSNPFSPD